MKVDLATIQDAEMISSLLSDHFDQINRVFGYNKLKSGAQRILPIISDRINDTNSQFKYFVLRDGEDSIGFVNLMITQEISEILALLVKPEYDNQENVSLLFNFSTEQFKRLGVKRIVTEVSLKDESFRKVIDQRAKIINAHYEINL